MNHHKRQSNIELLRILSMLMVIGLHCNFMSLGLPTESSLSTNFWGENLRIILENICLVSVNAFVLISGFFGIRLRKEKVFKYLFQVFFIATIVMIIAVLFWDAQITMKAGLKFYYSYLSFNWFVSGYLALMLMAPLVNSFVDNNNANQIGKMVFLFFIVDCVLGYSLPNIESMGSLNGYSIIHLLFIYSLGRLLYTRRKQFETYNTMVFVVVFSVCVFVNTIFTYLFFTGKVSRWYPIAYNNPFVVLGSVAFFLVFLKLQVGHNRIVNSLAASAFAVFLIHANTLVFPHFIKMNTIMYDKYSGVVLFCLYVGMAILLYLGTYLINQIQIKCSSVLFRHIYHEK